MVLRAIRLLRINVSAAWWWLLAAGLAEVAWAVSLKFSAGFERLIPTAITFFWMMLGFVFLALALKAIPISIAYAVFTSIGIAGTAIIGMAFLGESVSLAKITCLLFIVTGVVGIRLFGDQ